jgi:hypothetical protein
VHHSLPSHLTETLEHFLHLLMLFQEPVNILNSLPGTCRDPALP